MNCEMYDTAFRSAEQQISSELVKKKVKLGENMYWGRVKDGGMFPTKSGFSIKKARLSRIGFGQGEQGWEKISGSDCGSNTCSEPIANVIYHGSSDFSFGLERFKVQTQEICLSDLPFRQMAAQEMQHLQDSFPTISRYFWEDYLRTRYIDTAANKYVTMVSDSYLASDGTCDLLERRCTPNMNANGFLFWNRGTDGNPTIDASLPVDERFVSVNVPPSKIMNISELSGDLIEQAGLNLECEDDSVPFTEGGVHLHEIVVPDVKVGRRMVQLERMQEADCLPGNFYKDANLSLALGITRIIREQYGIRRDKHGWKGWPDDAYNADLTDAGYSPTDPLTWPRFRRVYAYIPSVNPNGTSNYITNPSFQNAPFGISTLFNNNVMQMLHHPEAAAYGSAKPGDLARTYGGTAKWFNQYDKICNPKQEKGHWELHFGAGIEPSQPELGNVWFHRIDHSMYIGTSRCEIPIIGCQEGGYTTDCYTEIMSGEAALGREAGQRGANYKSVKNSLRYWD